MLTHSNGNKPRSTLDGRVLHHVNETSLGGHRGARPLPKAMVLFFTSTCTYIEHLMPAYDEPVKIFMGRDKVESRYMLHLPKDEDLLAHGFPEVRMLRLMAGCMVPR